MENLDLNGILYKSSYFTPSSLHVTLRSGMLRTSKVKVREL